jgi:ribose transport system permease protein
MPEESPNAPAETPGDATQVEDAPRRTPVKPENEAGVGPTRVRDRRPARLAATILPRYGVLIAFVVVIIVFSIAKPHIFPTWADAKTILTESAPALILAVGLTVVLAMQDFDLSIGATVGLAGGVAVALMAKHAWGWPIALLMALGFGVAVGLLNGYLIAFLGGPSFIITLAIGTVLTGIEYAFTNQATVFSGVAQGYVNIAAKSYFLGLSNQIWIAVVVALVLWVLLDHTEVGRYMYAIGGNPEAARLSGIRTRALRLSGFVIVGLSAAVVGIILTSQGGSYTPNAGAPYLLPAYAAAFLGAACFKPGEFNVPGTVVGVLFLGTISTGLTILNLQTYLINLVQGGILVAAVLLGRLGQRVTT